MKTESRPWTFVLPGLLLVLGSAWWVVYHRVHVGFQSPAMDMRQAAEAPEKPDSATSAPHARVEIKILSKSRSVESAGSKTGAHGESTIVAQTAQSQAQIGWRFIETGDYQRAAQVFTQASRAFPDDASLLVGLGLCRSRLNQSDQAVAILNRALDLNGEVEHAHVLLGDLYFRRDELENSVRHYEAAVRQDPNDAIVQDGLLTARRAYRAEAHLHRVFGPHFVVKFESVHRELANDVIERLERISHVVGRQLGVTPEEAMIVILYSDQRFKDLAGGPTWAGGLYDGKIHLAVQTLMQKRKAADATLAHEYTHAIVYRLSGGHAPTWLQEGLALYFEGRPPDWGQDLLIRNHNAIVPLHALHGSFLALPPKDARLAYAEGYHATRAMIDHYGFALIRGLLDTLAVTPEFAAAFEAVFKKPYRDFETGWVSALAARRA